MASPAPPLSTAPPEIAAASGERVVAPVQVIDIDLDSDPTPSVDPTLPALVLARVHGRPIGTVELVAGAITDCERMRALVRAGLQPEIDRHLLLDELGSAGAGSPPACEARRAAALANAPRISVIVATRDRAETLARCLTSLLDLDYPDYEIVVVDNAPSTDATERLVTKMGRSSGQVRYTREPVAGLAVAHNHGLQLVDSPIVAFTDDDVIVDRAWLAAIAEGFQSVPGVGAVTGLLMPAELATPSQVLLEQHGGFGKGFHQRVFDVRLPPPGDRLFPFTAGRFGSGANMAFDRTVLHDVGGFDNALGTGTPAQGGDDLAAFFDVVAKGHCLVYEPTALVWHEHRRTPSGLERQAHGYGVGLGAYLTRTVVQYPRSAGKVLWRLPAGLSYAFNPRHERNRRRYAGWPADLARRERIGIVSGPLAYGKSLMRSRRVSRRGSRNGALELEGTGGA